MTTMRRKLQVLLIDDEGLLRDGLCAMLNLEEEVAVAGVVGGLLPLQTLTQPGAPDVIVADFGASAVHGARLVEAAHGRWIPGHALAALRIVVGLIGDP